MLIFAAYIVDEERLCVMKEENAAQHIFSALVPDELRMAPGIPHRNTEMVIASAKIIGNPRLCPCKYENPRFAIATDFVFNKCQPRLRPVYHDAGQNTLCGTALCHDTSTIEQVHRRMLIAADVSKRDAGDATAWNLL
jgi:hypothetical protein